MAAALALFSALAFGVSDFSGGVATRRWSAAAVVLVSNGFSLALAVLVAVAVPGSSLEGRDLILGATAGSVGLVGVLLLYRGLAMGPMSVVAPLTAVLSALIPVGFGVIRGERPGAAAVAGVALAVPAIILISRQPEHGDHERLSAAAALAAIGAGMGFGTFYVLLAQSGHGSLAWPLVAQRAASVIIVLVIVLASGVLGDGPPSRPTLGLAALAGATDFAANLAYLIATHVGLVALVAVLSSFYPAATVVLATIMLGERLSRSQLAGLVVAVGAVALIAVG